MRKASIKLSRVNINGSLTFTQGPCIIDGKEVSSKDCISTIRKVKFSSVPDKKLRDPIERLAVIKAQVQYAKKSFNSIMTGKGTAKIKIG